MALPVVPQVPRKKLLQMKLWAEDDAPAPELDFIQVPSHIRGSSSVRDHRRYANPAKSHDEQKKKGHQIQKEVWTSQALSQSQS
jgi:hypothetical protein